MSQIPNLVDDFTVPNPKYNHVDFLWAIDNDKLLYPRLLRNMEAAETGDLWAWRKFHNTKFVCMQENLSVAQIVIVYQ